MAMRRMISLQMELRRRLLRSGWSICNDHWISAQSYFETHQLGGLKDGREGDTDNEHEGHGPVDTAMVKGVKLTLARVRFDWAYHGEKYQSCAADDCQANSDPI